MDKTDQVALVTGGSTGIGAAVCQQLMAGCGRSLHLEGANGRPLTQAMPT